VNATPTWINAGALLLLHEESLAMFGGARGLRDAGLLESALARLVNQHLYEPNSDFAQLAAVYAFGLAKNHPFIEGNKRAALLSVGLFLTVNGWRLETTQVDAIETMLSLAKGTLDETAFGNWIREHIQRAD